MKFTGAVQDVTGLYYMQSRHYNPSTGSFLQQDSYAGERSSQQSQNRYTYSFNNPVNYIDPTGHRPSGSNSYYDKLRRQRDRSVGTAGSGVDAAAKLRVSQSPIVTGWNEVPASNITISEMAR